MKIVTDRLDARIPWWRWLTLSCGLKAFRRCDDWMGWLLITFVESECYWWYVALYGPIWSLMICARWSGGLKEDGR